MFHVEWKSEFSRLVRGVWIHCGARDIHGQQQFRARFVRTAAPTSVEGIEKFLGSRMIRGIGEKVFDVIEAGPERLREVNGIGRVRAKRITNAWAELRIVREIMLFLHSHGVGTARAVRVFRTHGADAV